MENNVIELRYDKVNEYFEKFKQKYTNDYEKNKVRGTKIVRNYYSLVSSVIIISICPVILTFDFKLPDTDYSMACSNILDCGSSIVSKIHVRFCTRGR